jgi:hypothetical protein
MERESSKRKRGVCERGGKGEIGVRERERRMTEEY